MVLNKKGGNKQKGQARKHTGTFSKLRIAVEGELYAVVTKILGNGMCYIQGIDNTKRLCIIRGKFRHRHDIELKINTWVLVGPREWEKITPNKDNTCDLLEIYSDSDKDRLKTTVDAYWNNLIIKVGTGIIETNNIDFVSDKDSEYINMIEQQILDANEGKNAIGVKEDDWIDVDDI